MKNKKYMNILAHYETCLEQHGDTHLGMDWPNKHDAGTRYRVMLEVVKEDPSCKVGMLDFGCGASHLYEYILEHNINNIEYSGLDLSEKMISLSRSKFPSVSYYCLDILDYHVRLPDFDYIVMNGVFTEKRDLSFDEMLRYVTRVLSRVFNKARRGIAFNVMSSHVEWERDDLFHLPLDTLAAFLTEELTRDFIIRNDYGLFEYTTYAYRRP